MCLAESQRDWCVCWTIYYGQDKLCSCSHKQMHCTNAFCILSVHEVGCETVDQSSLMICARLCYMYDSNLRSQWTCTVLWHCKVNSCGVWHQCSPFLKYKHCGVSHYPSQSVSLTAHSHLSGLMVNPFLHSQHKMVANSLTWWFQSVEKGTNIIVYMTL
jgi:hypothetical protein